jgi:hypothetical protein
MTPSSCPYRPSKSCQRTLARRPCASNNPHGKFHRRPDDVGPFVAFAHSPLFSPVLSTLETALGIGYVTNFPGLTTKTLRKHPPKSIAMTKGHQDQTRKNQLSTKKPVATVIPNPETTATEPDEPFPAIIDACSHAIYSAMFKPTDQIYSDQTGRFISLSSSGNNYMMIVYDYDSNHISIQPFRNRTAKCLLDAYKIVHARLVNAELRPQLQRLDNECSEMLKSFMQQEKVDFQLVPPGLHQRNAAKRARYEPYKTTSSLAYGALIPTFQSICGTDLFPKRKLH